jgi:transcriptional regulator with XRE-family HTH domain
MLADLIGRSQEWLRQVEKGLTPLDSLEALTRIAEVLRLRDWSELLPMYDGAKLRRPANAAHPLVEDLRRALFGLPPPSLSSLSSPSPNGRGDVALAPAYEVADLWSRWTTPGRRFDQVGRRMTAVLRQARQASEQSAGAPEPTSTPASRAHVRALLLLRALLSRLGEHDLAYFAAHQAVGRSDPRTAPVLHASCEEAMARELRHIGFRVEARDLAATALDRLMARGDGVPERFGPAAGLCLCVAEIEAELGNQRSFEQFLARAETVLAGARREERPGGGDPGLELPSPGPGAVRMVRVRGMLRLGQVELALHLAQEGDTGDRHAVDERVDHDIALAQAYTTRHDDVAALLMLLRVERVSPDDLRYDATAREVVQTLWHTVVPSVRTELAHLVERLECAGVDDFVH